MAVQVLLPKLGLTMQEGTIEEWLVPVGQEVTPGDPILRLATDKVDVDVEAEAAGRLYPVASAGDTLPPGAVIGWLLAAGEDIPGLTAGDGPVVNGGSANGAGTGDSVNGTTANGSSVDDTAGTGSSVSGTAANGSSVNGIAGNGGRLLASPNARRLARAAGLDLSSVRGSGPGGRIVSEDVEAIQVATAPVGGPLPAASPLIRRHARSLGVDLSTVSGTGLHGRIRREDVDVAANAATANANAVTTTGSAANATNINSAAKTYATSPNAINATDAASAASAAGTVMDRPDAAPDAGSVPAGSGTAPAVDRVIPLTGMRGTIARRMHSSLHEMAQLTHGFEVNLDGVLAVRAQLKREWEASGLAVPSINDFIVLAAARALLDHPGLNASLEDDGIHLLPDIHVGVAVAVPNGLLVPVVTGAAGRSLVDLAAETRTLAAAARSGKLALSQLEGATFVVTSLGAYGIDFFTPIVNPGNVAILGVGRVRDGVRWEDDVPRRTQVLTLSLTFDHRAVDGAPAAEYLRSVAALLEQPLRLLAR